MNPHALAVLEFARVLDAVAGFATSDVGRARVLALHPVDDIPWLEDEHRRVSAVRTLVGAENAWTPEPTPDLRAPLNKLRVAGTAWSGPDLLAAATLFRSSRRTSEALRDPKRPAMATAVLAPLAARLMTLRGEEDAIERTIADDGTVRDDASPALRRLRRELRGAHSELIALLERVMHRLESHQQVSDMSVTMRNGRYVIPVRRGAQGVVGGIVHDTSSTGGTLFVEPPAAVEFGNRIRELEIEEQREVDRILLDLTDRIRPHREAMIESLEALAELDALYARARFAITHACAHADIAPAQQGFHIRDGRHPLLLVQGREVVPFELEMEPGERTLLVSGPNTGGKTVLLKAIGLISALVQSGIPAPLGNESRVAIFDNFFADVGDEQSIEASLSTFSAHLKNLAEILEQATARSLVLIDELGSGTDPLEGASLGGAILEDLTTRGAMTVATTHLGALKELATEVTGVVNASLQFDAERLAPTYRLIKGIPGRSYGISIARRLALPDRVLQRAEERLPTAERDYNALLAELERRSEEMAAERRDLDAMVAEARERSSRIAEREKNVRARERQAEKTARQDARRFVLDARQEVERTIRELKQKGEADIEEAAREARRRMESAADRQVEHLDRLEREERNVDRKTHRQPERRGESSKPCAGDYVEVETLGGRVGQLLEIRDDDGVVAVSGMKLTVPLARLRRAAKQEPAQVVVPIRGDMPEVEASTEVDLRGMRVGEIDDALMTAIDAAVRADLRSLRIIHGKGTGALRERVTEMLRKDTRVRNFRLGLWNEGGNGVTVVDL